MLSVFLAVFAGSTAYSLKEVSTSDTSLVMTERAMEQVFFRSEAAHSKSMASIMSGMTAKVAWQVLEKSNLTTPALVELTNQHTKQSNLRKAAPTGYAAVDGARDLLNDMIFQSSEKYDEEIIECTTAYADKCAAMEECRGKIAASNFIAASSRGSILDSQKTINRAQVDIPTGKLNLKTHQQKCKAQLLRMDNRLKILQGDIAVLTSILKMTDCEKKFVQMEKLSLLHCQDPCTKKSFVTFSQDGLKRKVSQLQTSLSQGLMHDTFKDLFQGIVGLDSVEFLQLSEHQSPVINKTNFSNPPLPRTVVPGNPCTSKAAGAPTYEHKREAKCTIQKSPQCYKLQERFLLIQAGVKDERDNLLSEIEFTKEACDETSKTLQSQIQDDTNMLADAQQQLAQSMEKEATAAELARQTSRLNTQENAALKTKMHSCKEHYIQFETELCALKKIRGELYKMKGRTVFFQDCIVAKWDPESCDKVCGGGEQRLKRNIMTHPNGGAKCLKLEAVKQCNMQPCPVDCKLATWAGWSKCSADCGGGVQQRLREVKVGMKFGGQPCDLVSETQACNNQACEKDCVLSSWTTWSQCSKDCDGGTQKRQKMVSQPAEGAGKCAGRWSKERLEYKECNMHRCPLKVGQDTLMCKDKLDIVVLLDGSGSLGQTGWNAEIKMAQKFIDAFSGSGAQAEISVLLYSGPRTWGGVYKCFSKSSTKVDMAATCKIVSVSHFTNDTQSVKQKVAGLTWPMGSTLTSLALLTAHAELALGRKDAKSIVVAITDGRPLSYRATGLASSFIRKTARLIWVPVTMYAPLAYIKQWATRRWEENVVQVKTFADLEKPDLVTHIVANICPMRWGYDHWR